MLARIDHFFNSITMYRLVLYTLAALALVAVILGFLGMLPSTGGQLAGSAVFLPLLCFGANKVCAALWRAPVNTESALITGLILFFVLSPATNPKELGMVTLAGVAAMASKYVFAFYGRHLFNPAAFGAFVLGLLGSGQASWWVATAPMLIPALVIGLAVVRKVRRFSMFFSFLIVSLVSMSVSAAKYDIFALSTLTESFVSWPLIFFGAIMLTEPLTAPPTLRLKICYGALAGALMTVPFHVGPVFSSPELGLLVVNALAFFFSQKRRLSLRLGTRTACAHGVYEFSFIPDYRLSFRPGQYLEWTLPHGGADTRGIRRYFTIASSPTERDIKLGVRVSDKPSSFKKALIQLAPGAALTACHCAGDFVLPNDVGRKLGFIAGGIGITPFRSMLKYLLDMQQKRDIALLYASATPDGFCYEELFTQAQKELSLKYIPVVTNIEKAGEWKGRKGFIDEARLKEAVPDYRERRWYLSGPSAMVDAYKKLLRHSGVRRTAIITDYFPGF
ncbi:hypothetical protein A3J43_01785 [Candidatus Uhrbacteria bacterium RIFCSPHIGHO2_12_FULL_54_23]|uniref:FAD-binding FR-type domain-containing protein n=1 Tax=Candidatus Uhrbacteria bacterium RIFCSPHIGHO2_12_FULL_54_23 TaxID=1802397 RepID=A0A1F7UIT1_9BACT|nr:MAG: hypothetical protein A3J43_01785 [Candidatus Uhrbacteria bacterium RIFCSPHIGHO2_12_FULL_54_23]